MSSTLTVRLGLAAVAIPLLFTTAEAQAPGEVTGLTVDDASMLHWNATPGAADYNVYRGLVSQLRTGVPLRCHGDEIAGLSFSTPEDPVPGQVFAYLVTAESVGGEGTPGTDSFGATRALLGRCDPVVRQHLLWAANA